MCGIAGVVAWDDRYRVDRDTLQRMSARIAHRGPDGEGVYLNHEGEVTPARPQVGLVHRRLAILDPDPRSNQPFTDRAGRWIVFNGEIYNYRELRAELKRLNPEYEWRTDGDTEVLLVAYDAWGEGCVEKLNGMFAFAVWDGPKGELFLARDRMGQKPLYVATPRCAPRAPAVAFASELGVLRALPWFDTAVNDVALAQYLRYGYIGDESTIYRAAEKVAPALWRRFSASDASGAYYFSPNDAGPPAADPATRARELVTAAVGRQLVADVPLGCFLSGGIDSSIVACAMKRAAGASGRVLTFSIGFDDPRYDETGYAAAVAAHLGTEHRQFTARPEAAADLPKLAAVFGEPFGDSSALPTHYLARETRRHVKVALSGDGGDELFGGYDRYRAMRLGEKFRRLPRFVHGLASLPFQLGLVPTGNPKSLGSRVSRFQSSLRMGPARRYASYMSLFDDWTLRPLLKGGLSKKDERLSEYPLIPVYRSLLPDRDVVTAALATDRVTYLPDDLHAKVDRAAMLHALEVRAPFMDPDVVRFAAGLTTDQLLRGGPKRMLREAFAADLPGWVFKRRKMGFAVPIGDWFRDRKNAVRGMLWDSLLATDSFANSHFRMETVRRLLDEHDTGRADHAQRLYALLMLELWWQTR